MKTIVLLNPGYWEQSRGGAELQIAYLAGYLKTMGNDVHLIFVDKGTTIYNPDHLKLHPIKIKSFSKRLGYIWSFYARDIRKLLLKIKPDIVYTRSYTSWSGIAATYAQQQAIMHVWALASDNDVSPAPLQQLIRYPLNIIEFFLTRKTFYLPSKIIAQNRFQQAQLETRFKKNSTVIGQMTPFVAPHTLVKHPNILQILWIANLKPLKQPELFIDLAKRFSTNSLCRFIMIGRMGSRYEHMVNHAVQTIDNFTYMGEIPNSQVNDMLSKSHVLVNTSWYEGFSNTFVQAWMRKVVVLSMNSNPDNILTDLHLGYLSPSMELLAQALSGLLNDPELRNSMADRSYTYAVQHHSLEKNMQTLCELMELQSDKLSEPPPVKYGTLENDSAK